MLLLWNYYPSVHTLIHMSPCTLPHMLSRPGYREVHQNHRLVVLLQETLVPSCLPLSPQPAGVWNPLLQRYSSCEAVLRQAGVKLFDSKKNQKNKTPHRLQMIQIDKPLSSEVWMCTAKQKTLERNSVWDGALSGSGPSSLSNSGWYFWVCPPILGPSYCRCAVV